MDLPPLWEAAKGRSGGLAIIETFSRVGGGGGGARPTTLSIRRRPKPISAFHFVLLPHAVSPEKNNKRSCRIHEILPVDVMATAARTRRTAAADLTRDRGGGLESEAVELGLRLR